MSLIRLGVANRLNVTKRPYTFYKITSVGNNVLETAGEVDVEVKYKADQGVHEFIITFIIVKEMSYEALLGSNFASATGAIVNYEKGELFLKAPKRKDVSYSKSPSELGLGAVVKVNVNAVNVNTQPLEIKAGQTLDIGENLTEEQSQHLVELLSGFGAMFSFDGRLGATDVLEHMIRTKDVVPVRQSPYRYSPVQRREIQNQISEWLDLGIIVPSNSP